MQCKNFFCDIWEYLDLCLQTKNPQSSVRKDDKQMHYLFCFTLNAQVELKQHALKLHAQMQHRAL